MEKEIEAKALLVRMVCDKCGKGKMIPNGSVVLATYPVQYPHKCDNCGYAENYDRSYPYSKLVPKDAPMEESEVEE